MKGDYDTVLPDHERAFTMTKDWTGAGYPAVARAELAWWVARSDPATDAVDNVGRLIADTYGTFYDVPISRVAAAGRLRAEAAALRDRGGRLADWRKVSELLRLSYRQLYEAVRQRQSASAQGRMWRLRGAMSVTVG
jgi:hypothetical protein